MAMIEAWPPAGGRRGSMRRGFWLWLALVAAFFLWEAAGYRGLYRAVVEWQMGWFGRYLPMLSLALLALLLAIPALLLLRRREPKDRAEVGEIVVPAWSPAGAERFNRRLLGVFAGGGATFALLALAALAWTLTVPGANGAAAVATPAGAALPLPTGHVRLAAVGEIGRVVQFRQSWLIGERSVYFAPVFAPGTSDRTARLFVQVTPAPQPAQAASPPPNGALVKARLPGRVLLVHREERAGQGWVVTEDGVMVRGGMPGTIRTLYRALGYGIAPDYHTLYASGFDARWRWYMLALQSGACALLLLAFALVQRRHVDRIRRARAV